jgi:oxygen-independent coproporphyrinogen III oxidase
MIEHLYVHIPFCHRVCPYCAFYKHTPGGTDMAAFVNAVLTEARLRAAKHEVRPRTIFLGGGTPTALSTVHLRTLLHGLQEVFGHPALEELSVEANPRNVGAVKAAMLVEVGVTRVSLGVQAWDSATLSTLGRDHAAAEAEQTFRELRAAGLRSLNIDLMFSVPGQDLDAWRGTLERTLSLEPDHVSAYNLNYEEDTAFFDKLTRGEYCEDPDRDADYFFTALDTLEAAGLQHYEISNYARPGHRSVHNAAYWFGKDYLGLGPGAVSTCQGERWKNICDTQRYIDAVGAGLPPMQEAEVLSTEDNRIERIALELRTAQGVALEHVDQERLSVLQETGLIRIDADRVQLTRAGKILADSIASELVGSA